MKGIHLKDEHSLPITNNDAKFRFINHLVAWFDHSDTDQILSQEELVDWRDSHGSVRIQ